MAGITSLSKALFTQISAKTGDCALIELDEKDSMKGVLRFQYFPETISDSKQVGWRSKEIPGASLPVYQWVNSGERVISFTATFSTDVHLNNPGEGLATSSEEEAAERNFLRLQEQGESSRNVDIRSALIWLRRFMLPRYGDGGAVGVPITYAPRKCMLFIKGSGIGLTGGDAMGAIDHVVCVMTQCEITYEAFFPNNLPRIATVQLAFTQVPQLAGNIVFPAATEMLDTTTNFGAVGVQGQSILPYNMKPKG